MFRFSQRYRSFQFIDLFSQLLLRPAVILCLAGALMLAGIHNNALAVNGATFVSQSVPASMVVGESFPITVTMKNTGTAPSAWTVAGGYNLVLQTPGGWNISSMPVGTSAAASVAVNLQKAFTATITAPSTPGTYSFQWCMAQGGVQFGACSTALSISVAARAPDAAFTSQSMTATLITATRPITVWMKNTGNTTWRVGQHFMGIQNPPDNMTWGINRLKLSANVAAGASGTFTGTIAAPPPGYHDMQWQILEEGGAYFGAPTPNVTVAVAGGPPVLSVEAPTDGMQLIGNGGNIEVPFRASATPTGIATIARIQVNLKDAQGTYVALFKADGPVMDQTYKSAAVDRVFYIQAVDSFGKVSAMLPINVNALTDSSTLVSTTLPATMVPGMPYNVEFVLKNTGETTWSPGNVTLVPPSAALAANWGDFSVPLRAPVPPGGSAAFNLVLTAPATEGSYAFQARLKESTRTLFGATIARSVTVARQPPVVTMTSPVTGMALDIPTETTAKVRVTGSTTLGTGATLRQLDIMDGTVVIATVGTTTIDQDVELDAGTHTLKLRAVDNFNESAMSATATVTVKSNGAAYVSQSVPTTMQVGKAYTATVTMKNAGSKPWTAAAGYALGSQNPINNTLWRAARVAPAGTVVANGQVSFSLPLTAPTVPGTYNFQWQMLQEGGEWFGPLTPNVEVVVKPLAPTVTALSQPLAAEKFAAVAGKAEVRLQGSATAGAGASVDKLEVLDGTTVIATADGATIDTVVALAPGPHTLKMRATDNFDQVVTGTATTAITVLANNATAVSRTAVASMVGGGMYQVTVVMRNAGTTTWTAADGYALSSLPDTMWVAAPVPVTGSVAPGTNATFTFNVSAPDDPGAYPFQWQMLQKGKESFGGKSVVQNVTVTGVPPTVTMNGPASGSTHMAVNGYAQVPVSGTAAPTGSATITAFQVLDGTKVIYTGSGNTLSASVALAPGSHTLRLQATDSRKAVTLSEPTTVTVLHNDAIFVSQTVSASMYAGDRYTVALTVKNTGDTTWQPVSTETQLGVALAEQPLGNAVWSKNGRVPLTRAVAPGETYTFSFDVVAPTVAKQYPFQWRMSEESKEVFGTVSALANIQVTAAPVPVVSLSASPVNQRVAPGQSATVALTGTAVLPTGVLSKLDVLVDAGAGYGTTPLKTVAGNAAQLTLNEAVTLGNGSYRIKLRATDGGGHSADSAAVMVNVTDSPLLGQVAGVRSNGVQQLQLVGWTCRDNSKEALNYQVFANAPPALGGVQVANGVADLGSEADDAAVQAQCHTPGVSHSFAVDITAMQTQYPGAPLYVTARSAQGETIVLPCEDHGCRIPRGLRLGLTSPNVNNLDRFRSPMPVFVRAVVSGYTGTIDNVSFNINGEWLAGTAEGAGAYSVSKAGLPASVAPYAAYAKVRQGDATLITDTHMFYVDPGIVPGKLAPEDGATVPLSQPTVLSIALNDALPSGQVVKFFVTPKAAPSPLRLARMAAAAPTGNGGSVVGDGTFDGIAWNYLWKPGYQGVYDVIAKVLDSAGAVLMETSPITLNVNVNVDPAGAEPISVNIEPPHLSTADAGTLPGNLSVGNDGAAAYGVDLPVPPGPAGMQPKLSLEYSSLGTNGIAGLGWTLSGLSTIQRCPKTIAQDGKAGRISFDTADRLCIDGQRLVLANLPLTEDNYWALNAEYRTEINDFSRISRLPNQGFRIESKDGRISYYGTDSRSAMIAAGRADGQVVVWALDRVEDRKGNYLTVDYVHDLITGEFLPTQMRYGGNNVANQAADLAVRFLYEKRPDEQLRYIGGSRNDLHYRLTNIESYIGTGADGNGGKLVRGVAVRYIQSAATGRSLIASMQDCAIASNSSTVECMPETRFDWGAGGAPTWKPLAVSPITMKTFNGQATSNVGLEGDLDGSGRTSFIFTDQTGNPSPTPGALRVRLPDGREFTRVLNLNGILTPNQMLIGDLDGDGRDDLYLYTATGAATGSGGLYCLTVPLPDGTLDFACSPMPEGAKVDMMFDLRNDKRMHLVRALSSDAMTDCYLLNGQMQCDRMQMTGEVPPFSPHHVNGESPDPYGINRVIATPVDLSAQAMSDFYRLFASGENGFVGHVNVCFNQTQGVICRNILNVPRPQMEGPYLSEVSNVGDMNGDGISDIAYSTQTHGAQRTLNMGNGWTVAYDRTVARGICFGTESGADCKDDPGFAPYSFVPGDAKSNDGLAEFDRSKVGDFVGDGVDRMLFVVKPNTPSSTGARSVMCRYAYTGSVCQEFEYSHAFGQYTKLVYLDDSGVPAFLFYNFNSQDFGWSAFSLAGPPEQDKLIRAINGLGFREEVSYARGDDAEVYSRFVVNQGVEQRPVYPQLAVNPGVLVKELRQDNGQSGWLRRQYRFEGAFNDAQGRGELGFGKVQVTDLQSGLRTVSTLSQTYPFVGQVLSTSVTTTPLTPGVAGGPVVLSLTENRLGRKDLPLGNGATVSFPFVAVTTESRRDLDGSDSGYSLTSGDGSPNTPIQYDDWGNLLTSVNISVGSSANPGANFSGKTVNIYYDADIAHWQVGLLKTTAVSKAQSASNAAPTVRTTAFIYEPDNSGLVKSTTVEPDDIKLRVVTTLSREGNPFGFVTGKTVTWRDPASNTDLNRTEVTNYDGRFMSSQVNAAGHKETFSFDAATGALTSFVGPNLLSPTTWDLDGFGRVRVMTQPDGTQVRHYRKVCQDCPAGAVVASITDTMHGALRVSAPQVVYSDSAGRVVQERTWGFDGRTIVTDRRYDAFGRLYETDRPRFWDDPAHLDRRQQYDALNRVTGITTVDDNGDEHLSTIGYSGLLVVTSNAKQQLRWDYHDVLGRIEHTQDANGKLTQFAYDAFDNIVTTIDPAKHQTVAEYDGLGRRTALHDPDLGLLQYGIDPLGQIWSTSTPNQRKLSLPMTTFKYDVLGRLIERAEPDLISRWVFDQQPGAVGCSVTRSCGKLVEAYTFAGERKDYQRLHTYDALGRPDTTTQVLSDATYTHSTGYDAWGRVISQRARRGSDIAATKEFGLRYNANGYLDRIQRGDTVLWHALAGDAAMQPTQLALGNGLSQTLLYKPYTGRLYNAELKTASELVRLHEIYSYDPLGNVLSRSQYWDQNGYQESFTYDDLNRLKTSEVLGKNAQTFVYDDAGSILSKTGVGSVGGGDAIYHYPEPGVRGPAHGVDSIPGIGKFAYDDNGNLLQGAGRTLEWSSFDMPTLIKGSGPVSTSAKFNYGPEHQRTRQIKQDGRQIIYAGSQEVELDSNQQVVSIKTYWPNGVGVEIDRAGAATELYWTHADRLGSPMALTDGTGNIQDYKAYDAWGKPRALDGGTGGNTGGPGPGKVDNKGFTGHEMLEDFGLVHMNGRIYDPYIGRVLSGDALVQDPMDGQSLNRYSYVQNNPTNLTDPTGYYGIDPVVGAVQQQEVPGKALASEQTVDNFAHAVRASQQGGRTQDPLVGRKQTQQPEKRSSAQKIWQDFLNAGEKFLESRELNTSLEMSATMFQGGIGGGSSLFAKEMAAQAAAAVIERSITKVVVAAAKPAVQAQVATSVNLTLKFKAGWSLEQKAQAIAKVQLLNDGYTVVTKAVRSGTSASKRYKAAGKAVAPGKDVDHKIDLQLGGQDVLRNLWELDLSVNRSLGSQIAHQIKNLEPGTVIDKVVIIDRVKPK